MLPASLTGGIPLPSGAVLPTPVPTAGGDAQHLPPAGVVPGFEAHLPPGVDPANAVGPVQPEPPVEVPTTPVSHLPGAAVEAAPAGE